MKHTIRVLPSAANEKLLLRLHCWVLRKKATCLRVKIQEEELVKQFGQSLSTP